MSILEVSHRAKHYAAIHAEAKERVLRVLGLSADDYEVLFVGGGASMQFAMVPMNYLPAAGSADYVVAGEWGAKAYAEGRRCGTVRLAGTSEATNFSELPALLDLDPRAAYLHVTSNNTIEGTEVFDLPECGDVPLVADMSSDILAMERDNSRFSLIYAGAQKNIGPAGVTLVVVRKEFLGRASSDLGPMFSHKNYAKSDSLYNTPPVFAIYVLSLVMKWVEDQGGAAAVEAANRRKAALVYGALDSHPDAYEPTVTVPAQRSLMNLTFRLRDKGLEAEFLAGAATRGMEGLKGHRKVGGFRASMYNAFPESGAAALASYLHEFATR